MERGVREVVTGSIVGRSTGGDWVRLGDTGPVGRMWYSSWVGRELPKENEMLGRATSGVGDGSC